MLLLWVFIGLGGLLASCLLRCSFRRNLTFSVDLSWKHPDRVPSFEQRFINPTVTPMRALHLADVHRQFENKPERAREPAMWANRIECNKCGCSRRYSPSLVETLGGEMRVVGAMWMSPAGK
jgi:hypothetical protein